MKNFPLDPVSVTMNVPNSGAGVQFDIPAGAQDVLVMNPPTATASIFLRAGGDEVVANGTGASQPIEFPPGFAGTFSIFGRTKIAARVGDASARDVTLYFGIGQ